MSRPDRTVRLGPHAALLAWVERHHGIHDPGDVTWRHAVNTRAALDLVRSDPSAMAIEVDLSRSAAGRVIAAHPPAVDSDLDLDTLLARVAASSLVLKLDLKDPGVVEPVLASLERARLPNPVVLNADVFAVDGARDPPFDGRRFLEACRSEADHVLLSVGWSTTATSTYTAADVDAMASLTAGLADATFPVRAALLRRSPDPLRLFGRLLESDGRTLTLWAGEPPDQELLEWLSRRVDGRRAFVDLGASP